MVRGIMKKGLLGVGIGAAALFALFGTKAWYYACHYAEKGRDMARSAVPFEADVDAARRQVKALDPAIYDGIETLVKLEQSIKDVKGELVALQTQIDRSGRNLQALRAQLDGQGIHRVSRGSEDNVYRIKLGLKREIDTLKRAKYIQEVKQSELENREVQRQRLFDALNEMKAKKAALMSKIQEIEARHDAQELVGEFESIKIDTGALADAERAVAELEQRVSGEAREAELEAQFFGEELPTLGEIEPDRDVVREADEILGEQATARGEKEL
jgi:predicted  nucleic acid-binding Zn-ribbon protein